MVIPGAIAIRGLSIKAKAVQLGSVAASRAADGGSNPSDPTFYKKLINEKGVGDYYGI